MLTSPLHYLTDAVLRAPTIGCMLMCFAAALVGVVVFLRKQSLLGESLSHAAYPGVIVGVIAAGALSLTEENELLLAILIMTGASLSTLLGLRAIAFLERSLKIRSDSALCFVLAAFFGIGLTLVGEVQFAYTSLYRQALAYLYGQAATMTDINIVVYAILSVLVIAAVVLFYKEIQVIAFDRDYAQSLGINVKMVEAVIFFLITLAVVIGIRSVGVVLMSAMLISSAAAARQYTDKLYIMFILAGIFGLVSGFFGNYISVEATKLLGASYSSARIVLPTGPTIVIVSSAICLLSLMLAPKRGLLLRLARIARFRHQYICENLLKAIWRTGSQEGVSFKSISKRQSASLIYLHFILMRLVHQGWLKHTSKGCYQLTYDGQLRAARIVRLHRLWEVYLVDYLGVGAERVHCSAEEMEHSLTPELEKKLTLLLKDPQKDPHQQPIPPKEC